MYSSLTFYLPPALLLFLRVSTLVTLFSPRYLPFYIFSAAQSTLWNSHVILPTLFFYTAFAYLPSAIQPLFFFSSFHVLRYACSFPLSLSFSRFSVPPLPAVWRGLYLVFCCREWTKTGARGAPVADSLGNWVAIKLIILRTLSPGGSWLARRRAPSVSSFSLPLSPLASSL